MREILGTWEKQIVHLGVNITMNIEDDVINFQLIILMDTSQMNRVIDEKLRNRSDNCMSIKNQKIERYRKPETR